jgi:hypothetical protein
MLVDRKECPLLTTPRFAAIYPELNEPDYKFKKDTGEYHVRARIHADDEGWQPLIADAEAILEKAFEAKCEELRRDKKAGLIKDLKKAPVVRVEVDNETGDETGYLIWKANLAARVDIKSGPKAGQSFEKRPDIFNAQAQRVTKPPKIGNGSEMYVKARPLPYFIATDKTIGVRFELEAVQVLKVVAGGARTADYYGFGAEDGDAMDNVGDTGGFTDQSEDGDADF